VDVIKKTPPFKKRKGGLLLKCKNGHRKSCNRLTDMKS